MAFPSVCMLYCLEDGSGLLILPLINGFHGLHAILLHGWQWIAHSSAHQRLSRRFTHRIALWMASDCSHLHSSTAFTMVCAPYCSLDGIGLLTPLLVNGFPDGLRAVLLSGYPSISHSSTGHRLSQFACRFPQWMAAYCSFFHSSIAFTVYTPFCSADHCGLLILPLVMAFAMVCVPFCSADGGASLVPPLVNVFLVLPSILLCAWQHIAHSFTH